MITINPTWFFLYFLAQCNVSWENEMNMFEFIVNCFYCTKYGCWGKSVDTYFSEANVIMMYFYKSLRRSANKFDRCNFLNIKLHTDKVSMYILISTNVHGHCTSYGLGCCVNLICITKILYFVYFIPHNATIPNLKIK